MLNRLTVDVREKGGCIVIESIPEADDDLDALIVGITPVNLHDEVDLIPAVGNEAF